MPARKKPTAKPAGAKGTNVCREAFSKGDGVEERRPEDKYKRRGGA
jgi:hypothetical protein